MQHAPRSTDDPDLDAQIFVLRVPRGAQVSELEHVNAGTLTQHATLHEAFGHISDIVDPESRRNRRH